MEEEEEQRDDAEEDEDDEEEEEREMEVDDVMLAVCWTCFSSALRSSSKIFKMTSAPASLSLPKRALYSLSNFCEGRIRPLDRAKDSTGARIVVAI